MIELVRPSGSIVTSRSIRHMKSGEKEALCCSEAGAIASQPAVFGPFEGRDYPLPTIESKMSDRKTRFMTPGSVAGIALP